MSDLTVNGTLKDLDNHHTMGNWNSKSKDDTPKIHAANGQTVDRIKTKECLSKLTEALIFERSKVNNDVQQEADRKILDAFLQEVRNAKSMGQQNWSALQHYMYFIYRHAISLNPAKNTDIFPSAVFKKAKELVDKLINLDAPQLYIRLVTQIREYSLVIKQHIEAKEDEDISTFLGGVLAYYSAFCSAANKLAPLVKDFEDLISKRFGVNWIALNKSIFLHYIYMTVIVQKKLPEFEKFKNSEPVQFKHRVFIESYTCFIEDMNQVSNKWNVLKRKITNLRLGHEKNKNSPRSGRLLDEWEMYKEQLNIMQSNTWITRATSQIKFQDMSVLDAQVLSAVGDTLHISEFLIDHQGRCMCEDCMSAQLSEYGLITSKNTENVAEESAEIRIITCHLCSAAISIENFTSHIGKHVDGNSNNEEASKEASATTAAGNYSPYFKNFKIKPIALGVKSTGKPKFIVKTKDPLKASAIASCGLIKDKDNVKSKTLALGIREKLKNKDKENTGCNIVLDDQSQDSKANLLKPPNSSAPMIGLSGANNETSAINSGSSKQSDNLQKHLACQGHACGHKCKTEEKHACVQEALKKGGCPHEANNCANEGKDSKKERCDCTYCEVFGNGQLNAMKLNETRDRLRSRLNQRLNPSDSQRESQSPSNSSVSSLPINDNNDKRDIKDLVNFIEGNKTVDKEGKALKKAAKKARRKQKKLEEKEKALEEERYLRELQQEEEARRKAEELARAEALAKAEEEKLRQQMKQNKKRQKQGKKGNKQTNCNNTISGNKKNHSEEIEQTLPAMVTIKRVIENENAPPKVTITLKGTTPDEDKLLYTLVNGQSHDENVNVQRNETKANNKQQPNGKGKKKGKKLQDPLTVNVLEQTISIGGKTEECKISVDMSERKRANSKSTATGNTNKKNVKTNVPPATTATQQRTSKKDKKEKSPLDSSINLSLLRLPPGITITKVQGPPINRKNTSASTVTTTPTPQTNGSSGVIVVDTEKLIHEIPGRALPTPPIGKKGKKKNKNKKQEVVPSKSVKVETKPKYSNTVLDSQPRMVTLKNPIFHGLQASVSKSGKQNPNTIADLQSATAHLASTSRQMGEQASIIKNENGMVTIRSPRLQQSLDESGAAIGTPISALKPVVPDCHSTCYHAHDILVGLPGIEITKVDKFASKFTAETRRAFEQADVSIIPTNNGVMSGTPKTLNEIDWSYDSEGVFLPKDILEDDMDAEERELELFKRFCHQSVPPERKEKVAHLNVKDIVLFKKRNVNNV